MTNYAKCGRWVVTALKTAGVGFCVSAVAAGVYFSSSSAPGVQQADRPLMMVVVGVYGAGVFAAIPGTIAAWFLILHMLGQLSSTVRRSDDDRG